MSSSQDNEHTHGSPNKTEPLDFEPLAEIIATHIQETFEERIDDVQKALVELIINHCESISAQIKANFEARIDDVQKALVELIIKHGDLKEAETKALLSDFESRVPIFVSSLIDSSTLLKSSQSADEASPPKSKDNDFWLHKSRIDTVYAKIENTLRGPTSTIRQDQDAYLGTLVENVCASRFVIDIGCGRGEWLDAVSNAGFKSLGIEANPIYASLCRGKGHEITQGDALEALRVIPSDTARLISLFHVVEHLEFEYLIGLLVEAHRVLAPGGRIVIETPNPDSIHVATSLFWLDPTHRRPVPHLLMELILEALAFKVEGVRGLHPLDSELVDAPAKASASNETTTLRTFSDYSIIAHKA